MIYVENKDLVIPGEILAEEDYYSGRGTFKDGDTICSSLMGLVSLRNKKISVIPLKSKYIPKKGDVVIGTVDDVRFSMWGLNINSPYSGILPASEVFGREKKQLSRVFTVGDVLFLRVVDVDEVKKAKLGLKGRGMGKFKGGILVDISPTKVPRLIGKKGSMINMIKERTGCKIVVGQNGLVWVRGNREMEQITKNIVHLIEDEAHTSGLTNRIRDKLYLEIEGEIPENIDDEADFNFNEESLDFNENAVSFSKEKPNNSKFNKKDRFNNKKNSSFKKKRNDDYLEKPELQNFKEELDLEDKESSFNSFETRKIKKFKKNNFKLSEDTDQSPSILNNRNI